MCKGFLFFLLLLKSLEAMNSGGLFLKNAGRAAEELCGCRV